MTDTAHHLNGLDRLITNYLDTVRLNAWTLATDTAGILAREAEAGEDHPNTIGDVMAVRHRHATAVTANADELARQLLAALVAFEYEDIPPTPPPPTP